ncbi:MAG TPA: TolC family protein [Thermoanaerobaculia bacterium]|nr:TolC family protein [Thermoanaerobaculia bacterium]
MLFLRIIRSAVLVGAPAGAPGRAGSFIWARAASAAFVLMSIFVPGSLAAQQGAPPALQLEGPRIDLAEAIDRTLRNSPSLFDAEQSVVEREGVAQETQGLFDTLLFFDTNFELRQLGLLSGQFGGELRRRVPIELAAGCDPPICDPAFPGMLDPAADALARGAFEEGSVLFGDCSDSDELFVFAIQGGRDVTICFDAAGQQKIQIISDVDGQLVSSDQLATLARIQAIINILQLQLNGEIDAQIGNLIKSLQDEIREIVRQLRTTADIFRLSRFNLGVMPEVEQFLELSAEVGSRWQFRSGPALTATLSMLGTEDNYADKPLIVGFGDALPPNSFSVSAGLTLDVPLAAGRGRLATSGPSRAAETAVRAQQEVYQHTAAGEALRTIASYWVLAAAEEKVKVLTASVDRQARILDATRLLVDADELAAAEANRTEARYAQSAGQLATARQEVTQARVDLAQSMGDSPGRLEETPLTSQPLPSVAGETYDPGAWIERALRQRDDVAAAALATEATGILEGVARTDLRRRVDLSFNASFNAFEESFANRLYDLDGYWEAVNGIVSGPSYGVVLRIDLPFQNRTAKGRLAQARANTSTSRINEADIARQVRLQLTELTKSLERRQAQLTQVEESLRQSERALEASNSLYQSGELTLIDLLSTEEQVTSARLALVDLRAEIAILEAQVRFEAGELLEPGADQGDYRSLRLRADGGP